MNVADLNASDNPSSQDLQTIKQTLEAIDGLTEQLKKTVQTAAENGDSFDSVERNVRETVFRLGHQAMEPVTRKSKSKSDTRVPPQQVRAPPFEIRHVRFYADTPILVASKGELECR